MTLKGLSLLKQTIDSVKYPNMPIDYIPLYKYTDKTANGLTRCIIDYLEFNGCQAERISTTGRMVDNTKTFTNVIGITKQIGQKKWIKGSGTKGSADISATINGKSVKIEVKIGKDRQSEHQKKYQESIEKSGGIYLIAKSFEDFIKQCNIKEI
jgi:hypothetical protein